jgi:hypothetical protein
MKRRQPGGRGQDEYPPNFQDKSCAQVAILWAAI